MSESETFTILEFGLSNRGLRGIVDKHTASGDFLISITRTSPFRGDAGCEWVADYLLVFWKPV